MLDCAARVVMVHLAILVDSVRMLVPGVSFRSRLFNFRGRLCRILVHLGLVIGDLHFDLGEGVFPFFPAI